MATFGTSHPSDLAAQTKEMRSIQARRQMEQARLQRMLDPKVRAIGVDKSALDAQVAEKKRREQEEKARDDAFAASMVAVDHRLQLLDREVQRARKDQEKDTAEYRRTMQGKERTKEFDLNDPRALAKDHPAREGDIDGRLGPSAAQVFEGEDRSYAVRKLQQQSQMRNWVQAQVAEKQARVDAERQAEHDYAAFQDEVDQIRADMEEAETRSRKEMNYAVKDYNRALADAQRRNKFDDRGRRMNDDAEDINNHLTSTLLTEDPAATQSQIDSNRSIPYAFKGLSEEQREQIVTERNAQLQEQKQMRASEKLENQQWDTVQEAVRRTLEVSEREVLRQRQANARAVAEEQRRQAEEARTRKAQLNETYSNRIDDDFFNRFGTSCR